MHQNVIGRVFLDAHFFNDARGHGEGGNTRRTDHGIDFFLAEQIHELCAHHAARRIEHESEQAQPHDHQRFPLHELFRLHLEGNGDAEQQGDDVGEGILRRFGQGFERAAFPDEVAEHQHTDEGKGIGRHETRHQGYDDREENACKPADLLGVIMHADAPFVFRRAGPDDGGLNDGNQRHIRIGDDHNGAEIIGSQLYGDENGRGPVRRADDGDGRRVVERESDDRRENQGDENSELRRAAQDKELGIGKQRPEIDHGPDADEQQDGHGFAGFNANAEEGSDDAQALLPFAAADDRGKGNVDENGTEAHRQKKSGLHVFLDREEDQDSADDPHHDVLPLYRPDGLDEKVQHKLTSEKVKKCKKANRPRRKARHLALCAAVSSFQMNPGLRFISRADRVLDIHRTSGFGLCRFSVPPRLLPAAFPVTFRLPEKTE